MRRLFAMRQRLAPLNPPCRFFGRIYRILINDRPTAIEGRHAQEPPVVGPVAARPSGTAVADERRAQVETALQQLAPECRAVVVLHHFAGQSHSQIAETLLISERTVRFRLQAARQRLGEHLLIWRDEQ
jgi:RNA polymerase sigma factor (sigma-70 family)